MLKDELQKVRDRMESEENSQKYYRLLNSKDKTNNEMMILCSLAKVENSINDLSES